MDRRAGLPKACPNVARSSPRSGCTPALPKAELSEVAELAPAKSGRSHDPISAGELVSDHAGQSSAGLGAFEPPPAEITHRRGCRASAWAPSTSSTERNSI
jgi:hypothetical protein